METFNVFGMDLPVIADLTGGWVLVAHANGPGIACEDILCALGYRNDDVVPVEIHSLAIDKYREVSWPLVKPLYYPVKEGEHV